MVSETQKKKLDKVFKTVYIIIMRPKLDVKRTNIYLTGVQVRQFRKFAKAKGLTTSELIRRVLDEWLGRQSKKERG
jgi:hypothetical protein